MMGARSIGAGAALAAYLAGLGAGAATILGLIAPVSNLVRMLN
jgi:hypothetical protein